MFEMQKMIYKDSYGNQCGYEIQYRTRTLGLALGVLVWGPWTAWVSMPSVDVLV